MNVLLLITMAVFPFYRVLPGIELGAATISIYDGLVMIMIGWMALTLMQYQNTIKLVKFDFIVLLWVLVNSFTLLNDIGDFSAGLNMFRYKVAIPVSLYFLVRIFACSPKNINRLCWVFIATVALMGVLGVYEFTQTHERIQTTIGGPHAAGVILSGGLILGFVLWRDNKKKLVGKLALMAAVCAGLGAFLTLGRVLIPAILLFSILTPYLFKNKKRLIKLMMIGLLVVATVTPFGAVSYKAGLEAYKEVRVSEESARDMDRLGDVRQLEAGAGVRIPTYSLVISNIAESPIWGHGFSIYHQLREKGLMDLSHAHNLMLDVLLCTGVIGWVVFIWLLLSFISHISRGYAKVTDEGKLYIVATTTLLFVSITNGILNNIANLASTSVLWFYMALAINVSVNRDWLISTDKNDNEDENNNQMVKEKYPCLRLKKNGR